MESIKPGTAKQVAGAAADAARKIAKGSEEVAANGVDDARTAVQGQIGDFPRPVGLIESKTGVIAKGYEGEPVSIGQKPDLLEKDWGDGSDLKSKFPVKEYKEPEIPVDEYKELPPPEEFGDAFTYGQGQDWRFKKDIPDLELKPILDKKFKSIYKEELKNKIPGYDSPDEGVQTWQSRTSGLDLPKELDIPEDATVEEIQAALKAFEKKYGNGALIKRMLEESKEPNKIKDIVVDNGGLRGAKGSLDEQFAQVPIRDKDMLELPLNPKALNSQKLNPLGLIDKPKPIKKKS